MTDWAQRPVGAIMSKAEEPGITRNLCGPLRAPMGESLSADAPCFIPNIKRQERGSLRPVRTFAPRRDVLATLDAVPFTPSQGVCSPTPAHVMVVQGQPVVYPGYEYSPGWAPMGQGHAVSPRGSTSSSGTSESSGYQGGGEHSPASSQPGTPYGRPLLFSSFYFPMPFSPRALQQAALQGGSATAAAATGGGEPRTPTRPRRGGAEEGGHYVPVGFASPLGGGPHSPTQLLFSQFFAPDAFESGASGDLPDSPPEGSLTGGMGAGGSGDSDMPIELTPAARQIAAAMCAAQNLQGPPPSQLVELASLLQAYGLVSTLSPPPSASASPDKVRRTKSAPRTNADGTVRLNARQRRTLRRAQERAIKALMDMQTQMLGIDGEQAAANMAAMVGQQPMVFGSPPHSMPLVPVSAPPSPIQLQPIHPMHTYPLPLLPPAPHMMAGGWAAMPGPLMSQPMPNFPLEHAMSMPMPLGHGGPALPVFQHGFEFAPPMGHGGAGFYGGGVGGAAPRNGPGGYGGGGAMSRAASAPERVPASGGAGGGRLSRFAPPGSSHMSVEAH